MTLAAGTRLGPYEILSPLGAGGMGEVYRAKDTRLSREVAIKVLPESLASDQERLKRFEKEARSASALNHPNIVTIHDIGSESGVSYIAMELVEGTTLRESLASGPLPIKKMLQIAPQIAEGLARAHEAGIVHRDLKPENVMVKRDGLVKILDFGLAKLSSTGSGSDEGSQLPTMTGTTPGVIVGTVGYMSPEQAGGRPLDFRSDQFSLGAILYEMATGRRAFARATAVETLAAIVREEPASLGSARPDIPAPLRWVAERCLAKDPRERYASTEDLARDLVNLRDRVVESTSSASPALEAPSLWRRRTLVTGWFLSALFLVLLLFVAFRAKRAPPVPTGAEATITQLTNSNEGEYSGAISPDGRQFAFVSEKGGSPDIWVRQVSGGESFRITRDAAAETDLVYAPDGESLYYTTLESERPIIWRIPALGGTPRKVVDGARYPSPATDGRRLACVRSVGPDFLMWVGRGSIEIDGADGTRGRKLYEGAGIGPISWSPDGRRIAFNQGDFFEARNLHILDVESARERSVTHYPLGGVFSQAWLPDGKSLVISRWPHALGSSADLLVATDEGEPLRRLTLAVGTRFVHPVVAANGKRLIATTETDQHEVWRIPLGPDPESNGRNAVRLLDSSGDPFWAQVSRDGTTVLFNSTASGSRNLWTMPLDGNASSRQVTFLSGNVLTHSSLSPDGSRVAYASHQTGASKIWTANVDGSNAVELTDGPAQDFWPIWSNDGRWVAFGSLRGGEPQLWKVPSTGGQAVPITREGGFRGDWSPVDNRIVFWKAGELQVVDADSGKVLLRVPAGDLVLTLPVWSPDGRSFSAMREEPHDNSSLWIFDAKTGERRLAALLPPGFHTIFRAGWTRDGQSLIVNRNKTISHIVLLENF